MLVRSSDGSYETVDFREMAPAAAHRDMYEGNFDGSLYGGLARYVTPLLVSLRLLPRDSENSILTLRVAAVFRVS